MGDPKNTYQQISTSQLWDEIGFHKPMAGFWYNILYTIIGIIISSTTVGFLMSYFYPFPESFGYKDVAFGLYSLMFMIFDIGTGAVMSRFIPESNINDPEKMLHLIQYFIWYQMITGLFQTTIISIYSIYYVSESNISYAVWLMLIASLTQYPGFLGVFTNALDSLQHYNKSQTLRFLTGTLFQRVTELGFVYLGRLYGEANPQIGVVMGIALGSAVGLYVDDFFAMLLSAYFFSDVMKDYGITPRDCFRIEFTWEEVKPVVNYSVKTAIPGIISGSMNLYNLYLWLTYVPQYTTILIFSYIGGSIADIIGWFGTPAITPLVSESYMNNKKNLTQYYIGQLFRFFFLIQGFFVPIIVIMSTIMDKAWVAFGMIYYVPGTAFIIPRMIKLLIDRYLGIPGQVLYGANKPNLGVILGLISPFLNSAILTLFLQVWEIPKYQGLVATAWIMELGVYPVSITFGLITYLYVHFTTVKVKLPWKQMLIGLGLPTFLTFLVMWLVKIFVFDTITANAGFYAALLPSISLLGLCLIFVYFPLTALFGGWDDINLEEFRKVSLMSGPSKFLVLPIYKLIEKICEISPLHNKFQLKTEAVIREAKELLELKVEHREELKSKMKAIHEE